MADLIDAARLASVTVLAGGHHKDTQDAMCLLEAAAYVRGEPWSDHPACVCPVLGAFGRAWNDGLRSDEKRTGLLLPLLPKLIGTGGSTPAVQKRRAYMAFDWLVRVCAPYWMDLVPQLRSHAAALRDLEEITGVVKVREPIRAACAAALSTTSDRNFYLGLLAVRESAAGAANAAGRKTLEVVAVECAFDAAKAAAQIAAGNRRDLQPTVEWLQTSALDLVSRMIEVRP